MRVCLVHRDIHQITRGGICTLYRALAKRLDARGHEVTIITQDTPDPVRTPDAKLIVLRRTDDMTAHQRAVTAALTRIRPDVIDCSTWEAETLDYLQLPPQQGHRSSSAATCPPARWAPPPSPPQSRISSAALTGSLPSPRSPRATSQPPTASPHGPVEVTVVAECLGHGARRAKPAKQTL